LISSFEGNLSPHPVARNLLIRNQWRPNAPPATQNASQKSLGAKIRKLRGTRHSATQSPQFDVSFPEKLLKIVATRGGIFSLKFTKHRLAAGLRPDPLGELKRTLAAIRGAYF